MKEVRHGLAGANRWYIQRNTLGWRATREPSGSVGSFLSWKGKRFPSAMAAWVDAELRQWGEP